MNWIQLSIAAAQQYVEVLTALLEDAGALSVTLLDAREELLIEPQPGKTPLWEQVRIVALFAGDTDTDAVQGMLQREFPDLLLSMQVETLADCDWTTTWRDNFPAMQFGTRLWVCPTGTECPTEDAVIIRLDPGMAFGTGTHPTTAMCLEWLDHDPPAGRSVLDYGCGSGILAIAAGKLGAKPVHAVDIDPQAVTATRENVHNNGLDDCVTAGLPDSFAVPPVSLVMANILANPLCELAPRLSSCLLVGGAILLTGILEHQAPAVMAAYQPWVDFRTPQRRAEWVMLEGYRRRD